MKPSLTYDLRECPIAVVRDLCARHHGYGSVSDSATYAFAVYETGRAVAAYIWQPPPPGAARSVCPECPEGVLALSRMVAVPRAERRLRHVSTPLRRQMRKLIDRTRWPVLLTYSDEGEGHTGHVYKCSGWEKTTRRQRPTFTKSGKRVSSYGNGKHDTSDLTRGERVWMQRWEHWACARGVADWWMRTHGWRRVRVPGKVWRSGRPAYTYTRTTPEAATENVAATHS